MDLYLVTFQSGSRFTNENILEPFIGLGEQNIIDDYVYLFNSKFDKTKTIVVKSRLNENKFSEWLKNCYNHNLIGLYVCMPYKLDSKEYSQGVCFQTEIDKIKLMRQNICVDNYNIKTNGLNKESKTEKSLAMLEYEFDSIVGLDNVKDDLKQLYCHLQVLKEREKYNLPSDAISLHAVFKGAPGTGKTTIARIYGKLFKELGILKKGHLVELDRSDLVGQYVGHTELHTKQKLEEAIDGILFIDEAYSLKSDEDSNDFGKIAMEIILKFMEDNRDRISVIVAGYNEKMDNFLDSNEGLRSRFTNFYDFKNFSEKELVEIFDIMMKKEEYEYSPSTKNDIIEFFKILKNNSNSSSFGNAREVRNVCGDLKKIQAGRIYSTENFKEKGKKFLMKITKSDVKNLYSRRGFKINKKINFKEK